VGYALISAPPQVQSSLVISGTYVDEPVNVPSSTVPSTNFSLPVSIHRSTYLDTGVILVNPSLSPTNISLTLHDSSGGVIGSAELSLPPMNRLARFVSEWFTGLPTEFDGSVTLNAEPAVFAFPLRFALLHISFPLSSLDASVSSGSLTATEEGNPSPADTPPGVDFPLGFLGFDITGLVPGQSTILTLEIPQGVSVNTYYKFGPTPANPLPHWYDFAFDGLTGARFFADRIELHFVDGQRGDDDLTPDGTVTDPGAPAFREKTTIDVDLDIMPGADPNPINLGSKGTTPAAILSSDAFDASMVDVATVRLAGAAVRVKKNGTLHASLGDVNQDGLDDLVLHFDTDALALAPSDTVAFLTGQTGDGTLITGSDSVVVR